MQISPVQSPENRAREFLCFARTLLQSLDVPVLDAELVGDGPSYGVKIFIAKGSTPGVSLGRLGHARRIMDTFRKAYPQHPMAGDDRPALSLRLSQSMPK